MGTQLKKIGGQTLIYTAGIMIGKIASFVMLPVYTRYLTPADYGVLELLGMTIDVIGMITGIGLVAGVFKFYSVEHNPVEKKAVISTATIGLVALATVTSLLGVAAAPQLSRLIFAEEAKAAYLRLYFILFFLQNLEYVPLLLIRAENRTVLFVAVNALKLVATLSLNIFFVVYLRLGIEGVLLSGIVASGAAGVGLTGYLIRRVGLQFSTAKFRQMLSFGAPTVVWSLGSFVLVFSDRFFLNRYTDLSTVGIYSLAYKFAFVLSALAVVPFQTSWDIQRFEVAKQSDALSVFGRVFLYMNVVIGGVGLAISLFVKDFLSIMSDPAFLPAYRLVPLLVVAQVIFTWASYWNLGLYISGRTKAMASGALLLVPATLFLNFLLIPRFGIYGAGWATLAAYTLRFLWIFHFAQRYYPIRYQWANLAKFYGILAAAVALGFAFHPHPLAISIGWNFCLLLGASSLAYILVLPRNDRAELRSALHQFLSGLIQRRPGDALGD